MQSFQVAPLCDSSTTRGLRTKTSAANPKFLHRHHGDETWKFENQISIFNGKYEFSKGGFHLYHVIMLDKMLKVFVVWMLRSKWLKSQNAYIFGSGKLSQDASAANVKD